MLVFNSDKNTPNKGGFESTDSKKVINVSIDLIRDLEKSGDDIEGEVREGQWFEVEEEEVKKD